MLNMLSDLTQSAKYVDVTRATEDREKWRAAIEQDYNMLWCTMYVSVHCLLCF